MEELNTRLKALRDEIYNADLQAMYCEDRGDEEAVWEWKDKSCRLKEEVRQIRNQRTLLRRELSCDKG